MSARAEILRRIRTALGEATTSPAALHGGIERSFERAGKLDAHARLELLIDRLVDYDTAIVEVTAEAEIAAAISGALQAAGETRAVAAAEFPAPWLPQAPAVTLDGDRGVALTTAQIEEAEAVITTCELAVASTGTIFLVHSGAQGRRALTLLPDHHICVLRRDQVVETVPEALAHMAAHARSPITSISGPSATSDIEMTRIRGVHGPRRLTVILHGAVSS